MAQAASETILDALADPLLLLAGDRTVVFANRAAENALGGGLVGRNLASAVRVPAVLDAADTVFADGPAQEFSFRLGGDQPRHYTGRFQALGRALPRGAAVALALHDVTELEHTQKLRVDFVANASHEIRTPLATLIGVIETLQGPARNDEDARDRFLAMMEEHAQRIAQLVDDLLSLSRIELAEHEAPRGTVPVEKLLEEARAALDWMAEAHKVTITLDLAPDLPPVTGDADELHQLFRNLIDNAVKYGDADAGVTVRALPVAAGKAVDGWRAQGAAVAISVRDRGPGIPAEHIPRLTERFYRVDTTRSRRLGGTGLGLAIVKHIVNRHRGALAIDSTVGEGSTFTVYLPAGPAGDDTEI
jgi:two-component system phosphate regulon sensor histidine kinase PhoR